MTLLWTAIGMHPGYEMLAGWIEATAALLLAVRRTALLGSLLTIVVMSNVLLYNLFFDVPVKLGAANILILATAVAAPDLSELWKMFILHARVRLTSRWAPASKRRTVRVALRAGEVLFIVLALIQFLPPYAEQYAQIRANLRNPSPLAGEWHVDSVVRLRDGKQVAAPVLTGMGQPMVAMTLEPGGMVMVRAADGMLWRAQVRIDVSKRTLDLRSGYFEGDRFAATYSITQPDANHLVLEPLGEAASTNGTMTLSRIPLPAHYPLLERRFHWVNEWALER